MRLFPFLSAVLLLFVALGERSTAQEPSRITILAPVGSEVPTLIRSIRAIQDKGGPAIEVVATRPITPKITNLENPSRLVIDIPGGILTSRIRINFHDSQVRGVRVDQFDDNPPDARIVVDLFNDIHANWDAAGNRLTVRLHPPDSPVDASLPAATAGEAGSFTPVSRMARGSSVTAGIEAAVMPMGHGKVRVCPGTTISVSSSPGGQDTMLGMSTGALEADYPLTGSGDSLLTPDFRIVFEGPGQFHYAMSADKRGNTCVRALPGNTARARVSELMGNGVYQVQPQEEVVFRSGSTKSVDSRIPADCGCPAESLPIMRAGTVEPVQSSASPSTRSNTAAAVNPLAGSETASLPPSSPKNVQVQVEAPFVYQASPARQRPVSEDLPAGRIQPSAIWSVEPLPPGKESLHHGLLARLGGFFKSIFR